MTEQDQAVTEADVVAELNLELEKARKVKEDRLQGWRPMKDPGELMAGMWEVGIVDSLTYNELHKAFGDAWVWGPNVRVMREGKTHMATQFGVASAAGRQWSLVAEWPRTREVPKDQPVNWYLTGTGTDFDSLGRWLASLAGRTISITASDPDEKETHGVTFAFHPPKSEA